LNFSPAVAGFVSLNSDVEAGQGEVPWARQQLEPFGLGLYLPDNVMDVVLSLKLERIAACSKPVSFCGHGSRALRAG
jgi:hypothetical protein